MSGPGPLAGLRVLDLSVLLPGPVTTQALADLGADVIKVEPPGGDAARHLIPGLFVSVNRGKRSICLDLKDAGGQEAVHALAASCDAVVESFRPGVADRLGVGWPRLREVNPALVYCSLSGYGQTGVRRTEPGHDLNYLGLAGALTPALSGLGTLLPVADTLAGTFATVAVLAALAGRHEGGAGTYVDLSITEGVVAAMAPIYNEHLARGRPEPDRMAARPAYDTFAGSDGRWLVVGAAEDHFWLRLCQALGLHDVAARPELATWAGRAEHAEEVRARLAAAFAGRTRAECLDLLAGADVPASPVHDLDEALQDPTVAARDLVRHVEGAVHVGFPALLDGVRPLAPGPVPARGQHGPALLAEVGWSAARVARLVDSQVMTVDPSEVSG